MIYPGPSLPLFPNPGPAQPRVYGTRVAGLLLRQGRHQVTQRSTTALTAHTRRAPGPAADQAGSARRAFLDTPGPRPGSPKKNTGRLGRRHSLRLARIPADPKGKNSSTGAPVSHQSFRRAEGRPGAGRTPVVTAPSLPGAASATLLPLEDSATATIPPLPGGIIPGRGTKAAPGCSRLPASAPRRPGPSQPPLRRRCFQHSCRPSRCRRLADRSPGRPASSLLCPQTVKRNSALGVSK